MDTLGCTVCKKPVCPKHRVGFGSVSDGYSCLDCFGSTMTRYNESLLMNVQLAAHSSAPWSRWEIVFCVFLCLATLAGMVAAFLSKI